MLKWILERYNGVIWAAFIWLRRGHVACIEAKRSAYRILMGKPKGKRPLRRPRCRCEIYVKMDLREIGWSDMGCIHLAQDRDQ
jgi:hypothetical protein